MFSKINTFIAGFMSMVFSISVIIGSWTPPKTPTLTEREAVEMMEVTQDYVIVTSETATVAERDAAETLQKYLLEISGLELPIVLDEENHDKEIVVGITSREGRVYTIDRPSLGNEGVYIKTVGDSVVLTGGKLRGTLYAVYTFLEDYLGCRWFTMDLEAIPKAEKLMIPREIDYTHVPALEHRETSWRSTRDRKWCVANKHNGLRRSVIDNPESGGGFGYAGKSSHSLEPGRLIAKEDYEKFPEVMALGVKTGKRTTEQLCLTTEKTYELVLAGVFRWLEQYPNRQVVTVTQADNQNYCVCDNCKAIDEAEGSQSGTMLRFVNRIADAVAERYPERDVAVDTFAYQYTRKAPLITVPRDNVIVRLCSIECCFVHPLEDENCEENVEFMKDLSQWSKLTKRLHIWDYTTNYHNYNGPFNNWAVMQPNMRTFLKYSTVGIYEQGNSQSADSNGEFGDLRAYLLAKLMWDSETDVKRHMVEFCEAYYGDAAHYILRYLTLATERSGGKRFGKLQHMGIGEDVNNPGVMDLSMNDITYLDEQWAQAKALTTLKDDQLFHVRRSEISWRYWKATRKIREFNLIDYQTSSRELMDDMRELGIVRIHEGEGGELAEKHPFLIVPHDWSIRRAASYPFIFFL